MEDITVSSWIEELTQNTALLKSLAKNEDQENHPNKVIKHMFGEFFGLRKKQPVWVQELIEQLINNYLSDLEVFGNVILLTSPVKIAVLRYILILLTSAEYFLKMSEEKYMKEIKMLVLWDNIIEPPNPNVN